MFQNILKKTRNISLILLTLLCIFALTARVSANQYDCGTYGAGDYSQGEVCAAATDDENEESGGNGSLINTGQALTFLFSAILIIAGVTSLYKLTKKPNNNES